MTLPDLLALASRLADELRDDLDLEERQRSLPVRRAAKDYAAIRASYADAIYNAVAGYLDSELPVTRFKSAAGRAVLEAFSAAFYAGYGEASEGDTVDADDDAWLTSRMNQEIQFIAWLFDNLRELRKAGGYDSGAEAQSRSDGYANTLDSIFGEGHVRGDKNAMLTFDGPDGKNTCKECQRYKGQRHRAKWWLKRDLVRRNGNDNFGCGRWEPCGHNLFKDSGQLWDSAEL